MKLVKTVCLFSDEKIEQTFSTRKMMCTVFGNRKEILLVDYV